MAPTDELDKQIRFCADEVQDLRKKYANTPWAVRKAKMLEKIVETLTDVRRGLVMTGMSGKRLDARPDQAAIDAMPELQDKKALVCYFATDADRDEFAKMLEQWIPSPRSEHIP